MIEFFFPFITYWIPVFYISLIIRKLRRWENGLRLIKFFMVPVQLNLLKQKVRPRETRAVL